MASRRKELISERANGYSFLYLLGSDTSLSILIMKKAKYHSKNKEAWKKQVKPDFIIKNLKTTTPISNQLFNTN